MHTEMPGATGGAGARRHWAASAQSRSPGTSTPGERHPQFSAVLQTLQQMLGFPTELLSEHAWRWASPLALRGGHL